MATNRAELYRQIDSGSGSPPPMPQRLTLMLLGKTGSGKSSLGNAILSLSGDDAFPVTDGFCSAAVYSAMSKEAEVHGRLVKVVDTPGLMDTSPDGEKQALEGICDAISHCVEGVDAFLIVLRLDTRLTDEEWRTVDKLEELFGSAPKKFWRHVIVVFTHGDCIGNNQNTFEDQLVAATDQIPQMRHLLRRLNNKPILVDASKRGHSLVVACQTQLLLQTVFAIAASCNGKKYTNRVFGAVQESSGEASGYARRLEQQLQEANLAYRVLLEQLAQLQRADRQQSSRSLGGTVEDLNRKIGSIEGDLDGVRRRLAAVAMREACSGCQIL